jgi:putative ABC transport system permease protein
MRVGDILRLRLRSLLSRTNVERELDEEVRYHLERQIKENIAAGMRPEDARYAALRSLRDIEQTKEQCRDARGLNLMENAAQDLRYALRGLRKNPAFASFIVLVMGLGIGANTAVFSVVNAVLLRPLAFRDPSRIVTLTCNWRGNAESKLVALPDFHDWHEQSTAFSAMAYYRSRDAAVKARSSAEYVHVARVSAEFFQVLGIAPIMGRLFSAEEQKTGESTAALISYSYWQNHFGGNNDVLGQSLHAGGEVLTVIGVLPPRFHFPDKSNIWRTSDAVDRTLPRTSMSFYGIGRLKPKVTLRQTQAQLSSIASRLQHQYPNSNKDRNVTVTRMQDEMVGNVRLTLYVLLGAVGLVLLIACANIATLLLAKATARTREIAIRAAVGAGRTRIVRQLMTENLLLALLAGSVGMLVAELGSKALIALAPLDVPRLAEVGLDGRVLAFTFGVCVLCSLFFGLVPALHAARLDLNDALKQSGTRAVSDGKSNGLRGAFVVAEIALSMILLAGAGLLIKSFVALSNVTLGFRPEHVLLMATGLPVSGPDADAHALQFFKQLLSKISSIPGVSASGATMGPPGDVESAGSYWIDHLPTPLKEVEGQEAVFSVVTPGTFAALGIPLKRGRDFDDRDGPDAPFTVIVNETLLRRAFPGQDPIGRILFAGFDSSKPMKIVAVAGDIRQWGPVRLPDSEIYMPYAQHLLGGGSNLNVVVRTAVEPNALTSTLRRAVHELSSDAPVKLKTMNAFLYEEVATPRFRTVLFSIFAGLSLCLAIAGIYGVTAYVVSQRSYELGLRIAIGATPGSVLHLVLTKSIGLAATGMMLGLAGSLVGTRLIASILFEVRPGDPTTYICVAVLLALLVIVASYFPARRAARLDPLVVLRQQ